MDTSWYFPLALGIFSFGFMVGYFVRGRTKTKTSSLLPQKGDQVVLLAVTAIWCVSMVADILNEGYVTSPLVHGLMGAIVGFFYRPSLTKK